MNDATALMTRYLLGELSEREQADLEARYFDDPRAFDALVDVESALVDDYVRGRLTLEARQRFESHFMADPRRRERVRFAETLTRTIDRTARSSSDPHGRGEAQAEASTARAWGSWLDWLRRPGFALAFAMFLALVAAGTWLAVNIRRASEELAGPGADERRQASEAPARPPAGEVRSVPGPTAETTPKPAPAPRPVLAVATLSLIVGPGQRSADANQLPTLTIPQGTDQIRFALTLREHDHARYRVIVRIIGGPDVLRQSDLVPAAAGAQPAFALTAPAARFEPGDYMLTLQGATASGEYEDLSQSIFRIARQP